MCGISGIFSSRTQPELEYISQKMAGALHHRGPDQTNIWTNDEKCLGFAHNRLKIIDITESGAQPMTSQSGRLTICFNGEIYNFKNLKALPELSAFNFKGSSDTEVLLELMDAIGFEEALKKTEGMFALALWDNVEKCLFLARDRIGEKPLYMGKAGENFLFASELKAFCQHPEFEKKLDQESLFLYLKYNYVPAPKSIYQEVSKLPAGSYVFGKTPYDILSCTPQYYWDVTQAPQESRENWSEEVAIEKLEKELCRVLSDELIADVPLGAFLSGGIDSSLICALAQKVSPSKLKTFTIGFDVSDYDESQHAKAVANHLGTDHTEWIIGPNESLKLIPEIPTIYDEPFADSSQLPTTLLSQMARQHVTVALSGDGGDELFAGYNRHLWLHRIFKLAEKFPKFARAAAAGVIYSLPPSIWTQIHRPFSSAGPIQVNDFGTKFYKLAQILSSESPGQVYDQFQSTWNQPQSLMTTQGVSGSLNSRPFHLDNPTEQMMLLDTLNYLPDDIMVKVDRATMSTSLESRAPFLNHKVYELAWKMPLDYKVRGQDSKWILRQILYKYVPKEMIERPKQGFGSPLNHWFRNELRDWVSDMLSPERIKRQGLFNPKVVEQYLDDHLKNRKDNQYHLWNLIVFQSWYDRWL